MLCAVSAVVPPGQLTDGVAVAEVISGAVLTSKITEALFKHPVVLVAVNVITSPVTALLLL
jgi:hypothetical protein